MPQELEETLRIMFKDIQKPFDDNCPTERKNFLSYSYVLYKPCELLGEDEYLNTFHFSSRKKNCTNKISYGVRCAPHSVGNIPTV